MILRCLCVGISLAMLLPLAGCRHASRCCPPPAVSAYPCCPPPAAPVAAGPPPVASQAFSGPAAPGCCNGR